MVEAIIAAERNIAHRHHRGVHARRQRDRRAASRRVDDIPTLYRIHEEPDPVKVEQFEEFISTLGYSLESRREVKPRDFQKLVERMRGTPEEKPIAFLMLRTMQKARYDRRTSGHFGLAATATRISRRRSAAIPT